MHKITENKYPFPDQPTNRPTHQLFFVGQYAFKTTTIKKSSSYSHSPMI